MFVYTVSQLLYYYMHLSAYAFMSTLLIVNCIIYFTVYYYYICYIIYIS